MYSRPTTAWGHTAQIVCVRSVIVRIYNNWWELATLAFVSESNPSKSAFYHHRKGSSFPLCGAKIQLNGLFFERFLSAGYINTCMCSAFFLDSARIHQEWAAVVVVGSVVEHVVILFCATLRSLLMVVVNRTVSSSPALGFRLTCLGPSEQTRGDPFRCCADAVQVRPVSLVEELMKCHNP